MKKRNGKIEFMRFVACIGVLFFHLQKYLLGEASLENGIHPALFPHGAVGVEFFFLLSGFLMAASISRMREKDPANADRFSGREGIQFMKRKYMSVFPYHVIVFLPAFASYVLLNDLGMKETLLKLFDSVPSFFLLQMAGFKCTSPNHVEWYISCMLLAMMVLYPLARRFYEPFTRYIAPISAVLLLGWMMQTTGNLTGVMSWQGIAYKSLLRAVAEIMLGMSGYELSRGLAAGTYTQRKKNLLTLLEAAMAVFLVLIMIYTVDKKYELYALAAAYILIVLAFSGITAGGEIFDCKPVFFLGKFSLPLYLSQVTAINLVMWRGTGLAPVMQVAAGFGLTLVIAVLDLLLGDRLAAAWRK